MSTRIDTSVDRHSEAPGPRPFEGLAQSSVGLTQLPVEALEIGESAPQLAALLCLRSARVRLVRDGL